MFRDDDDDDDFVRSMEPKEDDDDDDDDDVVRSMEPKVVEVGGKVIIRSMTLKEDEEVVEKSVEVGIPHPTEVAATEDTTVVEDDVAT